METQSWLTLDVATLCNLLIGKPTLVGEGELQLIAVELLLRRAQTRLHLWKLNLADTGQLVVYLLGLEAELLLIGQVLPLATAAHSKVRAERLLTQR